MNYAHLADLVAAIHVAYVLGVVLGLVLVLVGKALGWTWIGNRWFRCVHLAMIAGVVARAALWSECPLTWWERDLLELGTLQNAERSAIGQFLHDVIHPDLPLSVFPVVYIIFALLIISSFWLAPVDWRGKRHSSTDTPETKHAIPTRHPDASVPGICRHG